MMITASFIRHLQLNTYPEKGSSDYDLYRLLSQAKGYISTDGPLWASTRAPIWLKQPQWDFFILKLFLLHKDGHPENYVDSFKYEIHSIYQNMIHGEKSGYLCMKAIVAEYDELSHTAVKKPMLYTPQFDSKASVLSTEKDSSLQQTTDRLTRLSIHN